MARILVTGGAGYVGSHACKALARAGHEPVALDNLAQGDRSLVRWGPLEIGDITDPAGLDAVFRRYSPEAVMHFAAVTNVGESVENPDLYFRTNVDGTATLLEAMERHRVDVLVFSSSCAVYGAPDAVPVPEDHRLAPVTPYGASKLMVERILSDFGRTKGLRSLSLRYFNAAGADPDGETGEIHDPETHAVPLLLMAATGRLPRFDIFGIDYPTPDGSAIRDYVHVSDLADAHVCALDYLLRGGGSAVVNLGTGRGTSVLQLVEAVERVTGRPVPHRLQPRRVGDPPILVADPGRAGAMLGWQPRFVEMADIIATAHAWLERPVGVRRTARG
jgi:UDP-arabinose 4-epimerase